MIKFRRIVPAIAGALALLAAPTFAGTPKEDISKGYAAINSALKRKNVDSALAHMTPDYVSINKDGSKSTRKSMSQQLPAILTQISSLDARTRIQQVKVKNKTATVRQVTDTKLTAVRKIPGARPSAPQTTRTIVVTTQLTGDDTWVQTPKGWRMKQSRTLAQKQSATVNGQPINPVPGGG